MKGIKILILFLLASSTNVAQIPSSVPTDGMLAYYSFNGNTNDISGNGNNLTNYNATLTSDRAGNLNSAYSFNGTSSYLQGPNSLGNIVNNSILIGTNTIDGVTKVGALTLSFWGKGSTGFFVSKYWNLDQNQSNFSVATNRISGDGTNYLDYSGTNANDWKHYAIVIKNGTNNSKVYVNGVVVATGTLNLNTSSTNAPFLVGKVYGNPEGFLNGAVDELAIFNRVLSDAEILAISQENNTTSQISLTLNNNSFSENGGTSTLTATLNKVVINDTLINIINSGNAVLDVDYKYSYQTKGVPVLLATTNGRNYSTQDYPSSLAIGKNLETYLVDRAVSTIFMLKNGNSTLEEFLKFGRSGCSTCLNWPDLIRTDPKGNIYVSESVFVQKIVKIDPVTKAITLVAGNNGKGTGLDQFMYISDFVVDKNQNIYVVDNGRIIKWAPNAAEGTLINFASTAVHIDIDKDGILYVSDNSGKLFKVNGNNTEAIINGPVLGKTLLINAFRVDKFKNILISEGSSANQNSPRIIKWYNTDKHAETLIGNAGIGTSINQLKNPIDLAVDSVGNVAFLDNTNFRIVGIPLANQIKILAGQSSGSIDLLGLDDSIDEPDETIGITLKDSNNLSANANLTITSDDLPPSLLFDLSANSTEESGAAVTVTARLGKISAKTITAALSLTGTATKTSDYTVSTESLTFAPGDSIKTFTITPVNDVTVEAAESVTISVASSTNLSTTYPSATINILSEDKPNVTFSLDNATIAESAGKAVLTATLSAATSYDVTFDISKSGTATDNVDYKLSKGGVTQNQPQITIAAGQTTGSIDILGINDIYDEADETVILNASNATNANLPSSSVTLTITSEDLPPTISLELSASTMNEPGAAVTLTGRLSKKAAKNISATISLAGTATKTSDYTLSSETFTFAPGDSIKTITITPVNDTNVELNETIVIGIASSTNLSTTYPSTITLSLTSDDNSTISLTLDKSSISENGGKAILTATLSAITSKDVTINFNILGSSEKNTDYKLNLLTLPAIPQSLQNHILLGDFQTHRYFISANSYNWEDSRIIADSLGGQLFIPNTAEEAQFVRTAINNSIYSNTGYWIGITDKVKEGDWKDIYGNKLSYTNWAGGEPNNSGGAENYASVWDWGGWNDAPISHYTKFVTEFGDPYFKGKIIIPAGQTTGSLEIAGIDDKLDEADETLLIEVASASNASPPTNGVTLNITSDDLPPTMALELSSPTMDEDKTAVTLTGRLSKKAGKTITATLAISGTAMKTTDFTLSSETLTFAPGDSIATVTITPVNDTAIEIAETIVIGVASSSGLDSNYPSATLNLLSEDKPNVTITAGATSINEVKGQSTITATLSAPTSKDVYIDLNLKGTATFDKDYQVNVLGKGVGELLFEKGKTYSNTTLTTPQKIAVDTANNLWVYDSNKLLKMDPQAKSVIKEINISINDIQITSDGIIHVMSLGGGLSRYNLNGELLDYFVLNNGNGNVVSFSFSNGNYYFFNLNNMTFYKLNYSSKVQSVIGSVSDINLNIYKMVVTDNETIVFADRSQILKYKNNIRTNLIDYSKYGDVANPTLLLLPNGNVLIKREPWPFNSTWDFNLEEFDLNGNKVRSWLNKSQSPIKNEFTGLGSFSLIPGKTDLYLSYYIEPNKLGTDYDKYNRNQIYKFPYKPSIKIPAGQTTGSLTFEGIEDLENENSETIDIKVGDVTNAAIASTTLPSISINDNRISFTAVNTAIPALTESALSWGDYDRDGDQDLAIMGYNDASGFQTSVWRNDNGTFVNTFQNVIRMSNGDIKWVDIDKDGYLDLMCSGVAIDANDVTSNKTVLYLNNKKGGLINAGTLNVAQLSGTKMAFGDLDNDGDLDLAILGYNSSDQPVFYLYEKDNNALAYNKISDFNTPTLYGTNLDWDLKIADFDLDGDNDILYNGGNIRNSFVQTGNFNFYSNLNGLKYEVIKLFNKPGQLTVLTTGQNQFYSNEFIGFVGNSPTLANGDIAAGDFNNDGLNDFVVTGSDASNNPKTLLYYQRPDSQFELMPNITLEGLYNSTADWVDYDVDGDLDLILTGRGSQTQKTIIYRNDTGTKLNKAPNSPTNLHVIDKGNGFVEFAWDAPSDDYSSYLGYNIRLGTSPGGTELSNTQSNLETGSRLITAPAPIYGNTYTTQLSPGKYYWSVQAIDQGFQGSPFATEKEVLLQYEWKTVNQKNIINRTISGGVSPKILMVDYDNDKDLDMIVGSSTDRKIYQYDGRMYVPSSINIGYGGIDNMVAEDINGDGKMDLVVNTINGSNLNLSIYFNNGSGYNLIHTMSFPSLVNSRIKVLDLDNDGFQEVLIAGSTSLLSTASTKVYRLEYAGPQDAVINPSGVAFNESTVNLTTGMSGVTTYDFGDINNDSKIDLIISGRTSNGLKTKIFLNNTAAGQAGDLSFAVTTDNLVSTTAGTTDLLDYDGDGDLDILQTGTSGNGDVFQLYENTLQNGQANFSVINIGIDPIRNSKVRYGDFNGDGYYDLFFNGTRTNVNGQVNQLVQLNPSTKLYETSTFNLGNLTNIEFTFADIEADGDLDLVVAGVDSSANKLNVYLNVRNQSAALNNLINQAYKPVTDSSLPKLAMPAVSLNRKIDEPKIAHLGAGVSYNLNTRPAAPAIKSLTTSTVNNQKVLTFAWNKSTDDHTPATGLTYNLRIGTTNSNDDILASNASNDGVLKIPMEGNAEHNLSMSLKNLKDGVYYWSVQAIDAAFSGSAFSTPVKFEILNGSLKTSNPPTVSDGSSTTNSAISEGVVIANLNASDPDGDPLTYSFVSGNESGIFTINASGQLILSTKPAIFQDAYVLVISVSDGTNSKTLTYRINLCESNFEATGTHQNITKTYKSKDSLKATSKVQGTSNVTMEAPKSIELKPGFVAEKGTVFRANIGVGCQ